MINIYMNNYLYNNQDISDLFESNIDFNITSIAPFDIEQYTLSMHDDDAAVVLVDDYQTDEILYDKQYSSIDYVASHKQVPTLIDTVTDNWHSQATKCKTNSTSSSVVSSTATKTVQTRKQPTKRKPHIQPNLSSLIVAAYDKATDRQLQVDRGTYAKSGPGRCRKNGHKTTTELQRLVRDYINDKVDAIAANPKCRRRKDLQATAFVRAVKKLPYFLVETCSTKNLYKRCSSNQFMTAFVEAAACFDAASNSGGERLRLVEQFVEFSVVYYSADKCRELIDRLRNDVNAEFLRTQLQLLDARDISTKKNIKRWASKSNVFRLMLELALDVLQAKINKDCNDTIHSLIKLAKYFISK